MRGINFVRKNVFWPWYILDCGVTVSIRCEKREGGGVVYCISVYLRECIPYLNKFWRKTRSTLNGLVIKHNKVSNAAPSGPSNFESRISQPLVLILSKMHKGNLFIFYWMKNFIVRFFRNELRFKLKII